MTESQDESGESREDQASFAWDPMHEALKRNLMDPVRAQALGLVHGRATWRRKYRALLFQARRRWVGVAMHAVAILLLTISAGLFAFSWPWSGGTGANSTVVAATASVTAFGSVLFTLLVLPLQAANQIGAGYLAELLFRPSIWLVGVWLILVATALFVLAAIEPDRQATVAAALLGTSALATVWISARRVAASSDPQTLAKRQSAFLRRGALNSRRYLREELTRSLPKTLRETPVTELVFLEEERRVLNGFLRQYRAGIAGSLSGRQAVAAINLWDGALESFLDFVKETDGAVGDSGGVTSTLLGIADVLVLQALAMPADDEAVYVIDTLDRLFTGKPANQEYAVVRSLCVMRLRSWTETAWHNDETRVTASAVAAISRLIHGFVLTGKYEDATQGLSTICQIAAQSVADSRIHIGTTAFQEIVRLLSIFLRVPDPSHRSYFLRAWLRAARDFPSLRLMEDKALIRRSTEAIYPGINLWGIGLQETLATATGEGLMPEEVATPLVEWVARSLRIFGGRVIVGSLLAREGMALLYCVALTQAFEVATTGEPRRDVAERIASATTSWVAQLSDDDASSALFDDDLEELLWSLYLTCGFIGKSPEIVVATSTRLFDRVSPLIDAGHVVHDSYVADVIAATRIACDWNDDEVEELRDRLVGDPFFAYRGIHIAPLGRVPAVNQNQAAVADLRLYASINEWALEAFPRFR